MTRAAAGLALRRERLPRAGFVLGPLLLASVLSLFSLFVPERAAADFPGLFQPDHHALLTPRNVGITKLSNRRLRITWTDPVHNGFEGVRAGIRPADYSASDTPAHVVRNFPDVLSSKSNVASATTITVPASHGNNTLTIILAAFFNNIPAGRAYSITVSRTFSFAPPTPSGFVAWVEAPNRIALYWNPVNLSVA